MRPALRLLAGASSRAPARTVTRLTPQQAAAAREAARLATLRNPPSPTPSTTAPSTAAAAAAGDTDQLPPGSRPVATPRPGGPQTDRRKSLVDSFRSLSWKGKIFVGVLLASTAMLTQAVDYLVPEEDAEQPSRGVGVGITVVDRK